MRSALTTAALAVAALTSTSAFADGSSFEERSSLNGSAKWAIEVDGPCVKEREVFDREIALACGAMTTCHVTPRKEEAELVATLRCPSGGDGHSTWSLDTRTTSGMMLGTISLTGATNEDRMREAAMEIARDAAPERTLATENLRNTLVGSSTAGPHDQTSKRRSSWWDDAEADARILISAAGFGSLGLGSEVNGYGARLIGAYRFAPIGHVTLSVAGASSGEARVPKDEWRRLQGSAGIGFGAPFDERKVFGLLAELGADGTQRYFNADPTNSTILEARSVARGYARLAGYLQFSLAKYVRPYLALSGSYFLDGAAGAAGDLGMTFPLF
jgi:hypothetical protein